MFSIRVHSLDDPTPSTAGTSRNPNLHQLRGTVHLYRNSSIPSTSSSSSSAPHPPSTDSHLPAGRGTTLFILAVPTRLLPEDCLRFCGLYVERANLFRVIRDDGIEDRYSVLVGFDDQKSADDFYLELNGWRFSTEGEVCHILFVDSVECTESAEMVGTAPSGATELPTCPVCIERLDQDISGIVAITCDHSFQCSCISKWVNSSCSVCQYCQKDSEKPVCLICGTSQNLWICLICGFVGCGRYKEGHAIQHWKDTQHCYSLDLETQRIWDYVGDSYVHRLNQSKSDDKLTKSKLNGRSVGGNCVDSQCSEDSGISAVLQRSKVEAIAHEYNSLLESQLENQRKYYDSLIQEAEDNKENTISELVEKTINEKMQEMQIKIDDIIKENKAAAKMNEGLMEKQNVWREKVKEIEQREKDTLKIMDEKMRDLEEEIRDYTFFIETQKKLNLDDGSSLRGGTVLPVPSPQPSASRTRKSKHTRKRN